LQWGKNQNQKKKLNTFIKINFLILFMILYLFFIILKKYNSFLICYSFFLFNLRSEGIALIDLNDLYNPIIITVLNNKRYFNLDLRNDE
jgi:hypothetical protein